MLRKLRSVLKTLSKNQETINQTTRFSEKMLSGKESKTFILTQLSPSTIVHTQETSVAKTSAALFVPVSKTSLPNVSTMT